MKIVESITVDMLAEMANAMYGNLIKADVDVVREVVIVDMEMHADGEAELLKQGSKQADLWGINLYPGRFGTSNFIEFDSMINLKPGVNETRDIDNETIRQQIKRIVAGVVHA